MPSAMDNVFGERPNRPDTPDFWKLSAVILRLDGAMEAATTKEEKDKLYVSLVGAHIDVDSLAYMAMQRAMSGLGLTTSTEVRENMAMVAKLASIYMDAFIAGCEYTSESPTIPEK